MTNAIDGLTFTPTAHQTTAGGAVTTNFTIQATNNDPTPAKDSTTSVIVTDGESAPTISGTIGGQTTSDAKSVSPFATVKIGELDDEGQQVLSTTATLSDAGNGVLSNLAGGSYDAATGVYTVSGTAASVTAALDGLVFTPTEYQASAGSKITTTFTIGVNDGVSPTVSNSATTVVATASALTTPGPVVAITGTDALAESGGITTTTIVGTVADNAEITNVFIYSNGAPLGSAIVNSDGSWSYAASFAAGTFGDITAVADDVNNVSASANAPFTLITGLSGLPYTSQVKTFGAGGALTGRAYYTYSGAVYLAGSVEPQANGGIGYLYSTGTALVGQPYSSYESFFADTSDQATYEGSTLNDTGLSGQAYYADSVTSDPYGRLVKQVFSDVVGQPYSSFEYDYIGGVLAGSEYTFTSALVGATAPTYVMDYDENKTYLGEKVFLSNIQGASYTGLEEDLNASGQVTRALFTGMTGLSYQSLEEDFSGGAMTGYKLFLSVSGQTYTNEEIDVSAANKVTGAIFSGITAEPFSSVQETFSNGALTSATYGFTNQDGQGFSAFQIVKNAAGAVQEEIVDNDDGSHTILGFQNNLTFNSIGDDVFTGGGSGETFVLQAVYGHETITDLVTYLSGAGHDILSFSTSEFANATAVLNAITDTSAGAIITAANGDTVTLLGVSKAMLAANTADLAFH